MTGLSILPDWFGHPQSTWGITRGYRRGQFRPRSKTTEWRYYNGRW